MLHYRRQVLHGLVAPVTELKTFLGVLLMLAVDERDGARDCHPREAPQSREVLDRPIRTLPCPQVVQNAKGSVLVCGKRGRRWIETLSRFLSARSRRDDRISAFNGEYEMPILIRAQCVRAMSATPPSRAHTPLQLDTDVCDRFLGSHGVFDDDTPMRRAPLSPARTKSNQYPI